MPRHRARLDFAMKVPGEYDAVGDADFALLGVEDAWDIGAISAFFALSNPIANRMSLRPNDAFFLLGGAQGLKGMRRGVVGAATQRSHAVGSARRRRRAMTPSSPRPASSMPYVSGSGIRRNCPRVSPPGLSEV
jgi:hypothetical protein